MGEQKKAKGRVSRRDLIRGSSEVIGAAAAISGGALFAQQATGPVSQRATSSSLAGRIIKAFVRRPRGASVQQVKLWTLRDDIVVVRTEASQCCYTIVNQGLDPTGLVPTRQAWEMTRAGGHLVTVGLPRGDISLPASAWSNRGRIHHAGQYGGVNAKTDIPKFIQMIEMGQFDAKALVPSVYPLERAKETFQAVGDRTTVGAVVSFL